MQIRNILLALAITALLVCPGALADGGEQGDWELGLYTGFVFLDDYDGGPVTLNPEDELLFGLRVGCFLDRHWSAEGSYQQVSTETDISGGPSNVDHDRNSVRFNVLRNFRSGEKLMPFATIGFGHESNDASPIVDRNDMSINGGGGLRWFPREKLALRFDARLVSTDVGGIVNRRQTDLETMLGVSWIFGGAPPGDADGDGVEDSRDDCPDTPRGARVDASGCPIDSDNDGVADGIDQCPDTKTGVPVDSKGCPKDTDGDGVHDGLDRCPDTPKGAKVDASGCPTDADGDGVADGLDRCPDTPKGALVDARGCPKDTDGDGVPDGIDKCPNTPKRTEVDAKGCTVLFEEGLKTLVLRGVNFAFNSAELTRESKGILDAVAASLVEWKEIRVEVSGHTDSKGADSYNQRLSQRRAETVRHYLAGKGVQASRMTAKGYGETRPVDSNDTDSGREQNRRVELNKLD